MEQKLISLLKGLETDAQALQRCLLNRDSEQINLALSKQEQSVELLDSFCNQNDDGVKALVDSNSAIRQLLVSSRKIIQTNRAMAQRFLDVVDQTLMRLGGRTETTYPGYGVPSRRAPVLVRQKG